MAAYVHSSYAIWRQRPFWVKYTRVKTAPLPYMVVCIEPSTDGMKTQGTVPENVDTEGSTTQEQWDDSAAPLSEQQMSANETGKGSHVPHAKSLRQLQPVQVWPLLERHRDALPDLPHPIGVYLCKHHSAAVLRGRHDRAPRVDHGAVPPCLILGVRVSCGRCSYHVALSEREGRYRATGKRVLSMRPAGNRDGRDHVSRIAGTDAAETHENAQRRHTGFGNSTPRSLRANISDQNSRQKRKKVDGPRENNDASEGWTNTWLSRARALCKSSQWAGPVVMLKAPGKHSSTLPAARMAMLSSGNRMS